MWRLLRLAFWLSATTALLYLLANLQRGRLSLALIDGVSVALLALGYRVSIRLGRPAHHGDGRGRRPDRRVVCRRSVRLDAALR